MEVEYYREMEWVQLAQCRVQLWIFVNVAMNHRIASK
jgi:hypothetical protein